MNRKARRGTVKKGVDHLDIYKLIEAERMDATINAVRSYSVAIAYTLFGKLHFGKKKVQMTIKQIDELFDSIQKKYVSIGDLEKALNEEADIIIRNGGE